jgi:hypothetical protein
MLFDGCYRGSILYCCIYLLLAILSHSECPNACSSHGRCGAYDMCTCYANYVAADCSESKCYYSVAFLVCSISILETAFIYLTLVYWSTLGMCRFGMAIVDTPKGDLDSSMKITGILHFLLHYSFIPPPTYSLVFVITNSHMFFWFDTIETARSTN